MKGNGSRGGGGGGGKLRARPAAGAALEAAEGAVRSEGLGVLAEVAGLVRGCCSRDRELPEAARAAASPCPRMFGASLTLPPPPVLPPDESTLLAVLPLPPEPGSLFPSRRALAAGRARGGGSARSQLANGGGGPGSRLEGRGEAEEKRGAGCAAEHRPGAAGVRHGRGAAGQAGRPRAGGAHRRGEAQRNPGEPGRGAQRLQQEKRGLHLPLWEMKAWT